MYNIKSTVNFPMRIFNCSVTAIDKIVIDISRNFTINSLINGFSNHDPQLIILENIIANTQEFTFCYVRNINSFTIDEFQYKLITECWEDIFEGYDTNVIFNNFLNISLKFFVHVSLKANLIPHTYITHGQLGELKYHVIIK